MIDLPPHQSYFIVIRGLYDPRSMSISQKWKQLRLCNNILSFCRQPTSSRRDLTSCQSRIDTQWQFSRARETFDFSQYWNRIHHQPIHTWAATYCKVVTVVCRWWEIKCEFSSWETSLSRVKIERSFSDATALISGLSMPFLSQLYANIVIAFSIEDDADDVDQQSSMNSTYFMHE